MRQIKFKAKRLDNGEWAKGSLVKTPYGTFIEWYEDSICNKVQIDPSTVCQFIGLTDKDGKEIWEHDLVINGYDKALREVIYSEGAFWASANGEVRADPLLIYYKEKLEVIGSKFDKEEKK